MKKIAFRTDASQTIGGGHVMRCLTLADSLEKAGCDVHFICQDLIGNLAELISSRGYSCHLLSIDYEGDFSQERDQSKTLHILESLNFTETDWVILDHYLIDDKWEDLMFRKFKVGVIDDLADRDHCCHFLIDQTLGRSPEDYAERVDAKTKLFCGANFCLIRAEILEQREASLHRRQNKQIKNLLINFGSTDPQNYTSKVLVALEEFVIKHNLHVTVVVGNQSAHLDTINTTTAEMLYPCEFYASPDSFPKIMAEADIAIGAAGSTTWERCVVGLPSLLVATAPNQLLAIESIENAGAAITYQGNLDFSDILLHMETLIDRASEISIKASRLISGDGASIISRYIVS